MNYNLLTNSTYLYVLKHPGEKIVFTKIAKELGITRQTVAKEYKVFESFDTLNIFNIMDLHDDVSNKYLRAYLIFRDLHPEEVYTNDQIADFLGISRQTLYLALKDYDEKESCSCVYQIVYNNQIIYIGSTQNFEERKKQHLKHLQEGDAEVARLYAYCQKNGISAEDVEISVIIRESDKMKRLQIEQSLLSALKPVGNDYIR